ncbi:MAG: ATP-binding cassette domain-containing protein [Rhodospirillaceae bacterium]|nr:ATP-binding cassette domain-containing protein [Rhodospirillaceae bacterium]
MSEVAIVVENLAKSFRTRSAGGLKGLFARSATTEVAAVRGISFQIRPGERVAFIGPNGAGKSTTLKMLTGILTPSSGHAEVAGFVPWIERQKLAQRIGILFGQRSQLWYRLPVRDSLRLIARIYGLDRDRAEARLSKLASTLAIGDLVERPVAQLSLGQRLRCEIAAALMHAPPILLLDEPTIGLDVSAKASLRDHLIELSTEEGTTILLTSHDTGDIERICERALVIDKGLLLLDRPLAALRAQHLRHRLVTLMTEEERPALDLPGVAVAAHEPHRTSFAVDLDLIQVERVVATALERFSVKDLAIENPPLDDVIRDIYRRGEAIVRQEVAA